MASLTPFTDAGNFYREKIPTILAAHYDEGLSFADVAQRFGISVQSIESIFRWDRYLKRRAERLPIPPAHPQPSPEMLQKFKPGRGRRLSPEALAELKAILETAVPWSLVRVYGLSHKLVYQIKKGTYNPSDPHAPRGAMRPCHIAVAKCVEPSDCKGRQGHRTTPELILEISRRLAAGQAEWQIRRECHVASKTVTKVKNGEHPLLPAIGVSRRRPRRYLPSPKKIERICEQIRKSWTPEEEEQRYCGRRHWSAA